MGHDAQYTVGEVADDDGVSAVIRMFHEIADEQSWRPGSQLLDYARASVHFAAHVGASLAGGLQLVPGSSCESLPCEMVWPDVLIPSRSARAHISIMAVRPEYRGTAQLLWPLCIEMWRYCAAHAIADISLEVTPSTYKLYLRLGWPLEIIGELRPHWGEECFLAKMGVTDVAGAMVVRAMRSHSYRHIVAMMGRPLERPSPLQRTADFETVLAKVS
ncbi:N-acyl amino acid synthase FeeM domain-containing protein [Capsulimonas corticalis]|nr:hypothetical protein [Capsulimonas corticalis]